MLAQKNVDIEPVFTDVDSHRYIAHRALFGHDLALHTGLAPYHLFRTSAKERRTRLTCGSDSKGLTVPPLLPPVGGHLPEGCPIFQRFGPFQHTRGSNMLDLNAFLPLTSTSALLKHRFRLFLSPSSAAMGRGK